MYLFRHGMNPENLSLDLSPAGVFDQERGVYVAYPTPAAGAGEQSNSFTLLSVLEACFRHRGRFLLVAGLVFGASLAASFLLPKRYQATMQLLVMHAREDSVISPETKIETQSNSQITDSEVNSQAELLRSRDVLSGALAQLEPNLQPGLRRDKEIERLSKNLDTEPVRQSEILNVSFVASSPEAARRVLEALGSSFVEKELALRRPTRGRAVFEQLVDQSRQELTVAEGNLATYKRRSGIASLRENESALLRQLEGTSTASAQLSAEIVEQHRRVEQTEAELESHPGRISTQSRATPNQRAVEDLTTKLVDLENERTALVKRYQPTEQNVLEVEEKIATVKGEIARQQGATAVETTTDVNPVAQSLEGALTSAQIASSALVARRRAVETVAAALKDKLDALEGQTAEYMGLEKRVTEAQHNFDLAVQKRDSATFDDALDRERILNVAFAARPSASSIPVAPKPGLYLALGLFSAIFLGVGCCIVTEMTRSVIHSPAQLEQATGVVTLATLPLGVLQAEVGPGKQFKEARADMPFKALTGFPELTRQGEA